VAYQSFYELNAWKLARNFKLQVYSAIKRLPAEEKFELSSQLKRAVRSIPANIAEGHGRKTTKDELHFCTIARGSLAETLNHLIDAFDCEYISQAELLQFKEDWDTLRRTLLGYMSFLQTKLPAAHKTSADTTVGEEDVVYEQSVADKEISLHQFFSELVTVSSIVTDNAIPQPI
jgi:four helix bundle protein